MGPGVEATGRRPQGQGLIEAEGEALVAGPGGDPPQPGGRAGPGRCGKATPGPGVSGETPPGRGPGAPGGGGLVGGETPGWPGGPGPRHRPPAPARLPGPG